MDNHLEALTPPPFESMWSSYETVPYAPPSEEVQAWARGKAEALVLTLRTGNIERYAQEHQAAEGEGALLFPSDAYRMHGVLADACSAAASPSQKRHSPMTLEVSAWAEGAASRMDLLHGWPGEAFEAAIAESARLFPGYEGANVILFLTMCKARSQPTPETRPPSST